MEKKCIQLSGQLLFILKYFTKSTVIRCQNKLEQSEVKPSLVFISLVVRMDTYPNHSLSTMREQESGMILPIAPTALQQVDGTHQSVTENNR